LNNKGDLKGAVDRAYDYAMKCENKREISGWLDHALQCQATKDLTNAKDGIGHFKHAFLLSYFFLNALQASPDSYSFEGIIGQVLMQGGDTDTNAAIVGGVIGAALGKSRMPQDLIQKLLACDTTKGKQKRPEFLRPGPQF